MKTARASARLMSLALLLHGCALSAIVDGDGGTLDESENNAPPLDAGEDRDEDDVPSASKPDANVKPSTPRVDAGRAPEDAGGVRDASIPADAAAPRDASTPVDAGKPVTPPDAATPTNPNTGVSCQAATDCTNACVPLGVFTCCRDDRKCGCTWAPGAYCL